MQSCLMIYFINVVTLTSNLIISSSRSLCLLETPLPGTVADTSYQAFNKDVIMMMMVVMMILIESLLLN